MKSRRYKRWVVQSQTDAITEQPWMSRGISYKTITAAKAGLGHYRNIMPSRDWRIIERTIVERVVR